MITQLDKHPKQYQRAIFLHVIGVTGLKLYNSIVFTALEDKDDVKLIIDKLESIIIGQVKVIYEAYLFNNQKQNDDETIDSYVAQLRKLAKTCLFCDCLHSSLIRNHLVIGIRDSATQKKIFL